MRTLAEYREQIRQIIQQGLVDIMLMSASTCEQLAIREKLFVNSHITPAARANDASDVFAIRGNRYINQPAQPFRTATIDQLQCGQVDCAPHERQLGATLGLYSVTFNNRLDDDLLTLEQYKQFRGECERTGFRHFLEVFDPNAPQGLSGEEVPGFINDAIARTLAGVPAAGRPLFLKVVYHGPRAMEELVTYDPHLVVGILGGGAGTTYDAFKLIAEAQKYGARVALFGRKINNAECQLAFVEFLRHIVDGVITPEEAVRAYHGVLQRLGIKPQRSLADDLQLQTAVMSYGGSSTVTVPTDVPSKTKSSGGSPAIATGSSKKADCGCGCGGKGKAAGACSTKAPATNGKTKAPLAEPDFSRMTQAEKLAYNKARRDRIFG